MTGFLPSIVVIVVLAGCDTAVSPAGEVDGGEPPACADAEEHSDLQWIQDEVLTPSCSAFSACHRGQAGSAAGLNLEAGNSQENLVSINSRTFPEYALVEPGNPDASYLLIIMGGAEGPIEPAVGTMPARNATLCPPILEATRRWIAGLEPAQ